MNFKNSIIIFIGAIFISSCNIQMKVNLLKDDKESKSKIKIIIENIKEETYKGWWVYGEGHHVFKDEDTLDEYDLEFVNENIEELQTLYLAVCEMEYFPMECAMTGYLKKDVLENQKILIVSDFEILYIEGCGE